ncbi:FecR protein [Roseimaritima multifibrata]|uniref:FecR protein n=1 Tax=Roseimaritima multifibrata TaxID=1930274 RepID=A0A517MHV6_9BACT|nr:FecR domain-containing protein [Roseimaritima multifibrata]QDS94463.1 FecR protein [Roseimaritima multifibrata]
MSGMKQEERLLLIDSLLDGTISDADLLRIEAEMTVDPKVRQTYYRRLQLTMLLERQAAEEGGRDRPVVGKHPRRRSRRMMMIAGTLAAIAAVLLVLFYANPSDPGSGESNVPLAASPERTASGFAILSGQDDAVWGGKPINDGDLLPSGELHLLSGRVQIELFSGVQIVLQGDSSFSIDSPMQVTMLRGIAHASVPEPAEGFRIKTSSGDVVDLGTEFSVDVDDQGADVHVVDGEVQLHPHGSETLQIQAGVSRRLMTSGNAVETLTSMPDTVSPTEFQNQLQKKQHLRLSVWTQSRNQIQSDKRTVAYYPFHSGRTGARQLKNFADGSPLLASDGTIVAASQATDRWGRSEGALDFSRIGSRVRLNVPGEHRGITMFCWVKINSLDRLYNSLFLTDGHDEREPHWQWMEDGRVFFSVKVPETDQAGRDPSETVQPVYYSPKIWNASLSGRWIMLAVTYDVENARVMHFLNGEPISSAPIADKDLVESIQIGAASICNWSEPMYRTDPQFVLRNLNGSMDEFALYSGALSADEILQLYRIGNPNEQ